MMYGCFGQATGRATASLEEQAAEAIRLGREVGERARLLGFSLPSPTGGIASSCVANWREGRVFEMRDEGALDILGELIAAQIEAETTGYLAVSTGVRSNEHGEDVDIVEVVRHVTSRGEMLLQLDESYRRFRWLRTAVLDRLTAEREIVRLAAPGR